MEEDFWAPGNIGSSRIKPEDDLGASKFGGKKPGRVPGFFVRRRQRPS
jgi:hypothetical protein